MTDWAGRQSDEVVKGWLRQMHLIRFFDEKVDEFFAKGMIHGTTHLCVGQEASAVGACAPLKDDDMITSTHRGHGHCIAKGAEPDRMMAELFGRVTGYCKGKGGRCTLQMWIKEISGQTALSEAAFLWQWAPR